MSGTERPEPLPSGDRVFIRRVLITIAAIAFALAAWRLSGVLMLLFGAVLLAVLLTGAVDVVSRHTFLNRKLALLTVLAALAAASGALVYLFGMQISGQVHQVFARAPGALDALGERFDIQNASDRVGELLSASGGGQLFSHVASAGYTIVGGVTDLVLVIVAAIYLSADPQVHRRGVARLFPPAQHQRILGTMGLAGRALRLWFLGQLASMVLVGTLSGMVFWIIGLPSPMGLGVIAGVTNFIPYVGPFVGEIPAALLAFSNGLGAVLWTIAAIVIVQHSTRLVHANHAETRGGFASDGRIVLRACIRHPLRLARYRTAAPLAVVGLVLVEKLWVNDVMGEDVSVPGEPKS